MLDNLTFTTTTDHDGALRCWDLSGPAGVVRFEIVDARGRQTSSIYLHDTHPEGFDLEACDVCGWHDSAVGEHAHDLRQRWERSGHDDAVIRAGLEWWYRATLATGAWS